MALETVIVVMEISTITTLLKIDAPFATVISNNDRYADIHNDMPYTQMAETKIHDIYPVIIPADARESLWLKNRRDN